MTVAFDGGGTARPNDIASLERDIGHRLPKDYLAFVSKFDGATPESNSFQIGSSGLGGVTDFIPVSQIASASAGIENLPRGAFPAAHAEGGNYVLIDASNDGRVLFWDHEVPDDMVTVSGSFGDFLSLLQPFDVKSVKLDPAQVLSAWIDPEFLKKFGPKKG